MHCPYCKKPHDEILKDCWADIPDWIDEDIKIQILSPPVFIGKFPTREELTVKRVKTEKPSGFFQISTGLYTFDYVRCDKMHELSFWKHQIKRAYMWYSFKQILKTKRLDWWNHGI